MKFYLINNTRWTVSEAFLKWLLLKIERQLITQVKHRKLLKRELGIVIVGAKEMGVLNAKYRNKKGPTDVLSFEGEGAQLGDIVICKEKVLTQAKEHQISVAEEFSYLVLHGLLHLLGYDHELSEREAQKMFKLQDNIFEVLRDKDILKAFKRL